MTDYKPNSHKYKEEQKEASNEKRVQKVVKGTAKVRKKSEVRKFADVFISDDAANVKSYILMDVLVPTIKRAISDIVTGAIDMIFNDGSGRSYRSTSTTSRAPYVSYSRFSDPREERRQTTPASSRIDFADVAFPSYGEAEAAIEQMFDVIDTYGFVTIGDLYDMAGLSQPYTSNRYGWTSKARLRDAKPIRVSGGDYIIKLPRAEVIE